jgi:hypothetical protein
MHEFDAESSAEGDHLNRGLARLGKCRVKEAKTQAVFKIANRVHEGRISEKEFEKKLIQKLYHFVIKKSTF